MANIDSFPAPSTETESQEPSDSGDTTLSTEAALSGSVSSFPSPGDTTSYYSGSAADTRSAILRAEWDDWKKRFLPNDMDLIGLATGNEDNLESEQHALSSVRNAFNTTKRSDAISRSRRGVTLSSDEQKYLDGKYQRAEKGAMVTNVNKARMHAKDRDNTLLAGGALSSLREVDGDYK